jgi:hypothetical protein
VVSSAPTSNRPPHALATVPRSGWSSGTAPHAGPVPANIEYDQSGYGAYNAAALINPRIGAVDVNLNWYRVEPQPGIYNFGPADQEVAAWAKHGKKVTLELRFQHERNAPAAGCASDGWLPTWEAARIPVLCEHLGGSIATVIPDYFNDVFQLDWRSYVATVATHFADGPYRSDVTYVRVALGLGAESFPLEPCYDPATQRCSAWAYRHAIRTLQAWGYSASTWLVWQERMLASYQSDFADTTVIYPVNQMLFPATSPLNVNPATGDQVDVDVARWAAAHGIGIGQEGLDGLYHNDFANFNEIAAYVHGHYPSTAIEFQTANALRVNATATCGVACLARRDVLAAEHYHARYIEWWSADDLRPVVQRDLAQWQRFVDG